MADSFNYAPLGWTIKSDPDGKLYYENIRTGETSWMRPAYVASSGHGQAFTGQPPQAHPSSATFSFGNGAKKPSLTSTLWSVFKEEFKKGLAEGLQKQQAQAAAQRAAWASYNSGPQYTSAWSGTSPTAGCQESFWTSSPLPNVSDQVTINGTPLAKVQLLRLKLKGYFPSPGQYWYDKVCGIWGIKGGPCLGILPPGMDLGGELQADASCPSDTGVSINGRLIHPLDGLQILSMGILPSAGRYWLDAAGRYGGGLLFPIQPGMLVLQALAVTWLPGADAFAKRMLDPATLVQLRMELQRALAAENGSPTFGTNSEDFASQFSWEQPSTPSSPNRTYQRPFEDLFKNLNLGREDPPYASGTRLATDTYTSSWHEEGNWMKEEEAKLKREREEQTRLEREEKARKEGEERARKERQEREERERQERQQREARARREGAANRQRAEAAAKVLRNKARWDRYTRAWAELSNATAQSRMTRNPRNSIPWPTDAGTFSSCQSAEAADIEAFFHYGLLSPVIPGKKSAELLAILKAEKVRWHPDKMQRLFVHTGALDDETLRTATAVSQVVNRMNQEEQEKRE